MNTLMNTNPWRLLEDLINTESKTYRSMCARATGRFPPVNVYLGEDAALIEVELPGKCAADVDLTMEPQAVILADRPANPQPPRATGDDGESAGLTPAWSRRIEMPYRINMDKVNAKFTDGILRIELPKAEAAGTRKIAIQ